MSSENSGNTPKEPQGAGSRAAAPARPAGADGSVPGMAERPRRAERLALVEAAFRSLPERYLGAGPEFDATYHIVAGSGLAGWLAERIAAPAVAAHLRRSLRQLKRLVEYEQLRERTATRRAA
jgi:hypothetical protein